MRHVKRKERYTKRHQRIHEGQHVIGRRGLLLPFERPPFTLQHERGTLLIEACGILALLALHRIERAPQQEEAEE